LISQFGSSAVFNFNSPQGIAYAGGKLYIGDNGNNRIAFYDTSATFLYDINSGGLTQPRSLFIYDNILYVGQWNGGIIRYDLDGNVISTISTSGGFVSGMTVYNDEVFASIGSNTINVYNLSGTLTRSMSVVSSNAPGLAVFNEQLIIGDHNNGRVLAYTLEGTLLNTIDEGIGWALLNTGTNLLRFSSNEIEIYGCDVDGTVNGCTDDSAHNFNLAATVDDGSCETCTDGILNGDESGVDCGGTLCDPCAMGCADLIISELTFIGGTITMTAMNIGDIIADGDNRIVMQAYWSDDTSPGGDETSGWTFETLDPGETFTRSTNQTNSNNRRYLVVEVDRDNTVTDECDETNNVTYIDLEEE